MLRHIRHWLLAVLLVACAPSFAAKTVMVFGDSLSAAYNLSMEQGWVRIVARRVEAAKLPWQVVNASITGETTSGGLSRLAEDLRRHKPAIVVIELGANDALRGLPVAGMRSNLEKMVRMVKQARAEPVLVGMMIPPNYGIDYAAQFRDMYAKLASRNDAALVPFLLEGVAGRPSLNLEDGIHPNAEGQKIVAANVLPHLSGLLR